MISTDYGSKKVDFRLSNNLQLIIRLKKVVYCSITNHNILCVPTLEHGNEKLNFYPFF